MVNAPSAPNASARLLWLGWTTQCGMKPGALAHMSSTSEQLNALEQRISRLAVALRHLRQQSETDEATALHQALRRRGLLLKSEIHEHTLVPRPAATREEFYALLRHYSFRLFLRDVIKHGDNFTVDDLTRYCSRPVAVRYLGWLLRRKLARRKASGFRLAAPVASFGPTLEWFVAQVLRREFGIPSAWNLRLRGARAGGDYDVVGLQEGVCIYVETKSSPPRNVECRQVRAFFDRLDTLRPQMAVFLNDTQLRMSDKIAVLFADELRRRLGRRAWSVPVTRLSGELFSIGKALFIANSDPDLVGNLGTCLAHYFRPAPLPFSEEA